MARAERRPHPPRRAAILVIAAFVVLAVTACGGEDDGAKDGDRPLSRRVYIERVNDAQSDAPSIFVDMSQATKNPASARPHLAALDEVIASIDVLRPPATWRDEHTAMLDALREMRTAVDVLSRAPASRVAIVRTQVGIYADARSRYEAAVRAINRSR